MSDESAAYEPVGCAHQWDTFHMWPIVSVVAAVKHCRECGADEVVWSKDRKPTRRTEGDAT